MNVALFVNRDIYCSVVLNHLLPRLPGHCAGIFVSDHVGAAPEVEALDVLRLLERDIPYDHVFPLIEAKGSGGELLTPGLIERRYGVAFETMNAPNEPAALELLRRLDLDVVVSIRYGRIFERDFLDLPRLGVLNLHSGILPDFRGVMASFRALVKGASEIGCTLHYIDEPTIDTGPVVGEWRRPVNPTQSYFGHVLSLYEPGARLVVDALARLAKGDELTIAAQSRSGGAYFSFPNDEDVARFDSRGCRLFEADEYRGCLARFQGS